MSIRCRLRCQFVAIAGDSRLSNESASSYAPQHRMWGRAPSKAVSGAAATRCIHVLGIPGGPENQVSRSPRAAYGFRPLHDRVVVKREAEERKSPGGIVIPDTASEKPTFGKVIAVGRGKALENGQTRAPDVNVGDRVLFGKYSGTEVKVDNQELVVMREEDVMAVVERP